MDTKPDTRLMWFGHNGFALLGVAIVVAVLEIIFGSTWLRVATGVGYAVGIAGVVLALFYHDRKVCQQCINATPFANPQKAVEKYGSLLYVNHFRISGPQEHLLLCLQVLACLVQTSRCS